MKTTLIIVFIVAAFNAFSQNPMITGSKAFYISTHGYISPDDTNSLFPNDSVLTTYEAKNINIDSTTLITLSLVDRDSSITNHWDQFKEKYRNGNYLLIVSNRDDGTKGDFAIYFYQQRLKGLDIKSAYDNTVKEFQNKYPHLKHHLNLLK